MRGAIVGALSLAFGMKLGTAPWKSVFSRMQAWIFAPALALMLKPWDKALKRRVAIKAIREGFTYDKKGNLVERG